MLHRSLFLICCVMATSLKLSAFTVREMAMTSNILLVAADKASSSKKLCNLNFDKISELSQKLQIKIDEKISKMNEKEIALLNTESISCEKDCTCPIYGLVFESKGIANADVSKKAEAMTSKERSQCLQKIKNPCLNKVLKSLKAM